MDPKIFDIINFVIAAHDSQRHKKNTPYACHPIRVAKLIAQSFENDYIVIAAALLHDVVEDSPLGQMEAIKKIKELLKNIGFSEYEIAYILRLVHSLTLKDYENKIDAIKRLSSPEIMPEAVYIKLADMIDNYKDASQERKNRHIDRAKLLLETYQKLFSCQSVAMLNPTYSLYLELKDIFGI